MGLLEIFSFLESLEVPMFLAMIQRTWIRSDGQFKTPFFFLEVVNCFLLVCKAEL